MYAKHITIKKPVMAIVLIAVAILAAAVALNLLQASSVNAVKASDFKPGRIIDDEVFYNSKSMDASQIQSFLNSKVPKCDTNGSQPASDWGRPDISRATLASYIRNGTHGYTRNTDFHAPPYTCLKDFKQNTPQVEAASGLGCNSMPARTSRTAAQIINDVSKACGINPQVLLVLLNKEQSLVTDIWPLNLQYERATGFACPDNAGGACDSSFNGFFRQVYAAARQFKTYRAYPNSYNYIAGRTNNILWQVAPPGVGSFLNSSGSPSNMRSGHCGHSRVFIENQATAALYIYTPYRPNGAAMSSYPGTGDACSAYGNRNFWFTFSNWFGSTNHLKFTSLNTPRFLKARHGARKYNLSTGQPTGASLREGQEIYFSTKTTVNGDMYLRTRHDTEKGSYLGIRYSDLENIDATFVDSSYPRWMKTTEPTRKINPITGASIGSTIKAGTMVFFPDKFEIERNTYVRSQHDRINNNTAAIPLSKLSDVDVQYEDFNYPRWMEAKSNLTFYDVKNLKSTPRSIPEGAQLYFRYKFTINGKMFVSDVLPENTGEYTGIDIFSLNDVGDDPVPLLRPRQLEVANDTQKISLSTNKPVDDVLFEGRRIFFSDKIYIGDKMYLITQHDSERGIEKAILFDDLREPK